MLPHVKREDITPMDVSSNLTHTRVFKVVHLFGTIVLLLRETVTFNWL